MKRKKEMSFAEQIHTLKTERGIIWIIVGVLNCFDSAIMSVLRIIALVFCIIEIFRVSRAKRENSDEMAEENLEKAKARTLDLMHNVFLLSSIIAMSAAFILDKGVVAVNWTKTVPVVFFIIYGIEELLTGLIFRKLEAE